MNSIPYAPGSDTSRDAAETGRTNAAKWRAKVAAMFATNNDGFTADELAAWFGVPANTIAPRITSLHQDGEIADTGKRRKTRGGKRAVVWATAVVSEWVVSFYDGSLCESVRLLAFSEHAAISRAKCIAALTGTDTSKITKITSERV